MKRLVLSLLIILLLSIPALAGVIVHNDYSDVIYEMDGPSAHIHFRYITKERHREGTYKLMHSVEGVQVYYNSEPIGDFLEPGTVGVVAMFEMAIPEELGEGMVIYKGVTSHAEAE